MYNSEVTGATYSAGWLRISMHPLTVSVSGEATFELVGATTSSG